MAKRVDEDVRVLLRQREEGGTIPAAFFWRQRRYEVLSVAAIWRETGRWWDGELERTTYRVTAAAAPASRASALSTAAAAPPVGVYELSCFSRGEAVGAKDVGVKDVGTEIEVRWRLAEVQD